MRPLLGMWEVPPDRKRQLAIISSLRAYSISLLSDAAYLKAVTEHERLTARFQSLRDEVAVKHREVTATFNGLLTQVARLEASQTNQAVN
jgi:hypothetical protein